MKHREYRHLVDGAETAILFIHGINGTPNHFNRFLPLVPDHISVLNLLLDGHGGDVKDFSRTSMQKWEAQVQRAVDELSLTHKQIFITAHSMGTLFAIEQAIKNRKIAALFLLSVPIRVRIKGKMLVNTWKICCGRIKPGDRVAEAAKHCCGIRLSKNPFLYVGWIPRYLELFAKIRRIRADLSLLQTSCTAYQSRQDELVSVHSIPYLKEHSRVSVVELKHSGHFFYDDEDYAALLKAFANMLG